MRHTLEKHSVTKGPALSPLAGKPAPRELLIDVARLEREYLERKPDMSDRSLGAARLGEKVKLPVIVIDWGQRLVSIVGRLGIASDRPHGTD